MNERRSNNGNPGRRKDCLDYITKEVKLPTMKMISRMNRKLPRKISMDECSLTKCRYFNNIWSGLRYLLYYTVIMVHRLQ
jgi:hypothetical protein